MMINKSYAYLALHMDTPDITPTAKFILIQMLYYFGFEVIDKPIKDLARPIGLTDKAVKPARELLLKQGFLVQRESKPDGKGRPKIAFQVSPTKVQGWIDSEINLHTSMHYVQIERLLFPTLIPKNTTQSRSKSGKTYPRKCLNTLTTNNRLLLAILFYYADQSGVVRGLGLTRLSNKAGMTLQQLKLQLKRLILTGYLFTRFSGLSGHSLFGKCSGELFLNMYQGAQVTDQNSAGLILMLGRTDRYNEYYWGWRILNDAWNCKRKQISVLFHRNSTTGTLSAEQMHEKLQLIRKTFFEQKIFHQEKIENQFSDTESLPIIRNYSFEWTKLFEGFQLENRFSHLRRSSESEAKYLQYKINTYASTLLSEHWNSLEIYNEPIHQKLVQTIGEELYPVNLRGKTKDPACEKMIADAMGLMIFRIACETAYLAKMLIINLFRGDSEVMHCLGMSTFTLLPVKNLNYDFKETVIQIQFNTTTSVKNRLIGIKYSFPQSEIEGSHNDNSGSDALRKQLLRHFDYHLIELSSCF
jgi:hypothetical protein